MEEFRIDLKEFSGLAMPSNCQKVNIKLILEQYFPESPNLHDPYIQYNIV